MAKSAVMALHSAAQQQTYRELLDELDNIRAVLDHALRDELLLEDGLKLAADLTTFWWQNHLLEGLTWLQRLTDVAGDRSPAAARALVRGGLLASYGGKADDAIALAARGVETYRRLERANSDLSLGLQVLAAAWSARGERERALAAVDEGLRLDADATQAARAIHLVNHGNVMLAENLVDQAATLYEESREYFERQGDSWLIAGPLARLGDVAGRRGQYERAIELLVRALATWQQGGGTSAQARTQAGLARAHFLAGDHDEALTMASASFAWARETGSLGESPWAVAVRAAAMVDEDRLGDAGLLFGASRALGVAFAQPMHGCLDHDLGASMRVLVDRLGEDAVAVLWDQARGWTVEQTVAEVSARWA